MGISLTKLSNPLLSNSSFRNICQPVHLARGPLLDYTQQAGLVKIERSGEHQACKFDRSNSQLVLTWLARRHQDQVLGCHNVGSS
ncbi:hypothetical protein Peur_055239 [Populus x canadensis]